jgi:hypothetical protein
MLPVIPIAAVVVGAVIVAARATGAKGTTGTASPQSGSATPASPLPSTEATRRTYGYLPTGIGDLGYAADPVAAASRQAANPTDREWFNEPGGHIDYLSRAQRIAELTARAKATGTATADKLARIDAVNALAASVRLPPLPRDPNLADAAISDLQARALNNMPVNTDNTGIFSGLNIIGGAVGIPAIGTITAKVTTANR